MRAAGADPYCSRSSFHFLSGFQQSTELAGEKEREREREKHPACMQAGADGGTGGAGVGVGVVGVQVVRVGRPPFLPSFLRPRKNEGKEERVLRVLLLLLLLASTISYITVHCTRVLPARKQEKCSLFTNFHSTEMVQLLGGRILCVFAFTVHFTYCTYKFVWCQFPTSISLSAEVVISDLTFFCPYVQAQAQQTTFLRVCNC